MNAQGFVKERFWRATALGLHELYAEKELATSSRITKNETIKERWKAWNRSKNRKHRTSPFCRLCLRCQAGEPSGAREKSQNKANRDTLPSRSCAGPWWKQAMVTDL